MTDSKSEENSLPEEIDSYMQMLEELDLYVIKLTTKEEIVGIVEEENEYSVTVVMPVTLLPTLYMIDRWRPADFNEEDEYIDGEEEIGSSEIDSDNMFEGADPKMADLYNENQIQPTIWGRDDFLFQQRQHQILFAEANSKRIIPFYHMMDWFQHTDDSTVDINKMTIISKAQASFDLKHEYMSYFRDRAKERDFEIEQQAQAEQPQKEPEIKIEEPHFGTLELKTSQFSSYQSKFIH
jgi:hypothetical protein